MLCVYAPPKLSRRPQGILQKYKNLLANSLEGRHSSKGAGISGADEAESARRIQSLEGEVLEAKMESKKSKDDAAKVYLIIT